MVILAGYQVVDKLYESSRTLIYRGQRQSDQTSVILKCLKSSQPTLAERVRLRNHYTIAAQLSLPGIVYPLALERDRDQHILVMPDEGLISLADYYHPCAASVLTNSMETFLAIAIQLADILDGLSHHHIIHKDIKPSNILIHPATRHVKLTDFGLASQLPQEMQDLQPPTVLEGTLAYMAPEQTGRMNRGIDYRSDFYSLGVTFYELLSGNLPFQSDDPLELVHCHLAKEPVWLEQCNMQHANCKIPQVFSDIVLKLMAKNAEERYQSAVGLKADLERCLADYRATGAIAAFPLGRVDEIAQLNIPQKLYGRERSVQRLLEVFERVSQGSCELVLVTGYAGVGKTRLINELLRSLTRHRGYFIAGKFDQLQRDLPLQAPMQAWRRLMRHLLSESPEQLQNWRVALTQALGINAQIIVDLIPELALIIGPQPPAPEVGAIEARNRMIRTFHQFNQVFQSPLHPVVFFMDDGQWADATSCQSLQTFMQNPENHHWLMIAAYRESETSPTHPLRQAIAAVRQTGATITEINLEPLALPDVAQLLAETLHTATEAVYSLARLLYEKTAGNPFFLIQLLKSLHEDGLIEFQKALNGGAWRWDLGQIQQREMTDNVVDLMIAKITKLPAPTQRIVQLAACIGNAFDLQTLAIASEQSLSETAELLWAAAQTGLIVPVGEGYRLLRVLPATEMTDSIASSSAIAYRFLHDRVQQAAYMLIPEDQKQSTHLAIGRLLLQNATASQLATKIFAIVNHWNLAIQLITDPSEKSTLAKLNLMAGRKAKASSAYASAFNYLEMGLKLLPEESWLTQYELMLALHVETAEVAALNTDFDRSQQLIEQVLECAKTSLDQVKAYNIQIQNNIAQSQFNAALQVGQQILPLLGVMLPDADAPDVLPQELATVADLYTEQAIESLLHLPQMVVPEQIAAMQILARLWSAAFMGNPALCPLIVLKQVELSLQYGHTSESPFAYAVYATILISIMGEIETGYQFGQLALNLLNHSGFTETRTRTEVIVQNFVNPWKQHLQTTLVPLLNAYQTGLETGDFEFASYAAIIYCYHSYFWGKELTLLEPDMRTYTAQIEQLKQFSALTQHQLHHQAVLNLLGRSDNPMRLMGEVLDEERLLLNECPNRTTTCGWHIHKLMLAYLFEDRSQAIAEADAAAVDLPGVAGLPYVPVFHFYRSLAYLRGLSEPPLLHREQILEAVAANQDKMQLWALHAPMNHQHKYDLVEAERCRVLGDRATAMELYDRAIAGARAHGYLQEAALANELAAKFYLEWGKPKIAIVYLQEACDRYAQWGARAKRADLERRYAHLFAPGVQAPPAVFTRSLNELAWHSGESLPSSLSSSPQLLDLAAVVKASQAISQEIQIDRLLATLMQVVMENAGAQTGSLVLKTLDDWQIVAVCPDPKSCQLQAVPIEDGVDLPLRVIHYVQRTQEATVIDDVAQLNDFATDPYWERHPAKSVLCAPVVGQGKLMGVLYLENQVTAGAFTRDRQEVVQLIATQAAISLENAQLYRTLEQQVEMRTQELSQALADLQATQQDLIQSEKMAALGQLTASVAHEINTPLGVIRAAAGNMQAALTALLEQLPPLQQQLTPAQQADFLALIQAALQQQPLATQAERQLRRSLQAQLQTQGMAEPARVAHWLTLLRLREPQLYPSLLGDRNRLAILEAAYNLVLQQHSTTSIQQEVDRAAKIVFALKTYSFQNRSGEKSRVDITESIEIALTLYQNRFRQGIEVVRDYDVTVSSVLCNPDELTQVWVNLIDNALHAMVSQGRLEIGVRQLGDRVQVEVTDSGEGIPAEIQARIFKPFFTTKPRGEGSGLGLDIVRQIVEHHAGAIAVKSQPGRTTFTVSLPV